MADIADKCFICPKNGAKSFGNGSQDIFKVRVSNLELFAGEGQWKKNPGKRDGPAGRKSGAQRKTGLVGERQLQPYAAHGAMRNNYN